ncbi:MAG TPA: thiamine phosphate synthase [Solirubrobacteraceae bacterium]|nr:thiamine phosphate synthase [Solirubrobacteraceae bacterium]
MLAHFRSMLTAALAAARLYLIADARTLERVGPAAVAGGVAIVQLRDGGRDLTRPKARALRDRFGEAGALFIVNDDAVLAAEIDADGVHVGQDDMAVNLAREIVGPERLIGLSTHSKAQIEAAEGVDYIGVGPVWATPTKPGYAPVGLELVRYAAAHARVPFFAIGGINPANAAEVFASGARQIAVVRAIGQADDPRAAAAALLEAAAVVRA